MLGEIGAGPEAPIQALLGPRIQKRPLASGPTVFGRTNYAFDTYQLTEAHLSDPDVLARLNALSREGLVEYQRRVHDPAVHSYIDGLIARLPCDHPGQSRTLDLQPVFLRTDATDAAPTGTTWTSRFNQANLIWGKLGVTFNALSAITLDTPLKTNGTDNAEINAVRALRTGSGVEVFLVDNEMASSGGASKAPGPGASCGAVGNIVMSDRGTSNTLLAHELGHILGLQHPGTPPNPGEAGTIMEASNSNSAANPTRNTMANYNRILCPAPSGSTCLNPDT